MTSRPESSWSPSFSLTSPPLPDLRPHIASLRTALLGYLSEVERSLQGQVQATDTQQTHAAKHDEELSSSDEGERDGHIGVSGMSTGIGVHVEGEGYFDMRHRSTPRTRSPLPTSANPGRTSPSGSKTSPPATGAPTALDETNLSLLTHLSTIREDVRAYLPALLSMPSLPSIPTRDWLRSLPSKLSVVDVGVDGSSSPPSQDADKGKGKMSDPYHDVGAVDHARRKVMELVRDLLPSEDWAGWEKLGWEEQDLDHASRGIGKGRPRAFSSGSWERYLDDTEGEEEHEEPEYLFPNRTPASAKAMATRRRAVRSKSFSAPGMGYPPIATTSPSYGTFDQLAAPRNIRRFTEPASRFHALRDGDDGDSEVGNLEGDDVDDTLVKGVMATQGAKDLDILSSEMGPTVAEALAIAQDGRKLITYEDLPFFFRNNEHILTGYRFIPLHASTGPVPLIKSAFTWHNETINIHSHFIPSIMIIFTIPAIIYNPPLPDAHPLDTAILILYLIAAISCMTSSAGWHVLSGCASKRWFEWGACVDYIGISWLIAASFGTVVYNGFYCHPKTVLFYCSINFICGLLGSYLPFQRWFNERKNKNWRIGFFLFLCFAMVTPMLQLFLQHGYAKGLAFVAPFGLSVVAYVTGLLFYAFHIPESIWPGRFDRVLQSHQIWHAAIVLAIILHYRAVFVAHSTKFAYSCATPNAGLPVSQYAEYAWRRVVRWLGG